MSMYLLWLIYALVLGFFARTLTDKEKKQMGKLPKIRKEGPHYVLYIGGLRISLLIPVILIVLFMIIGGINDATYAIWVGSIIGFLELMLVFLIIGLFVEISYIKFDGSSDTPIRKRRSDFGDEDNDSSKEPVTGISPVVAVVLMVMITTIIAAGSYAAASGSVAGLLMVILTLIVMTLMYYIVAAQPSLLDENMSFKIRRSLYMDRQAIQVSMISKVFLTLILFFLIIMANITPLTGQLEFNDTFKALNDTEDNTADAKVFLTDSKDVRVISWDLATQYLQRAYSDAASQLSTDQDVLTTNTDPDYVNGKFVWVNAPQYESMKWFGGKTVPFYVYVVNDPENMTEDGFEAVHRSNRSLEVQREKISWQFRIDQLLHDRYAGKYVTVQIRINLDDDYHPYWVVYLGKRHVLYDVVDMEKILIIDAHNFDNYTEFDVDDEDIPEWLEVVYPDYYIMDWAERWGKWREGIMYKWFNKRHLSYPDDSPRFIVLNGTSYWYVPMRQLDSKVLAGYILMDTRTGETTYHNREAISLADTYTARLQVSRYLSSGVQGYRKLTIQEGYLYPIHMDYGRVREAYIFPLYSGFTIQQYAIVDAQYYTQTPFFGTDIQSLLGEYRSHVFETAENVTHVWENFTLENAYADDEEGAFTANGTTYIVTKSELSGGEIRDVENEWREFRLAVSDYDRGDNVTIDAVVWGGKILDVDYPEASLIEK